MYPLTAQGEQASLCTPLALKLLDESFAHDPVVRERFMREGELLCRLSHPNLVKGYALGHWREQPFFIMERIEGLTLAQSLQASQQPQIAQALAILRDVLSALNYLSLDGRVSAHRDIKPSNIMFDARGTAKLIDLGIAKTSLRIADELDTRFLGSFHYVAPEQIDNAACVDIRADIYALGAVFYEMCVGKRAFTGENSRAILAKHLTGTIPILPHTGAFAHDEALWEFCNKILQNTLALDCLNRFQTPSEFLAALEEAPAAKTKQTARLWNPLRNHGKDKVKAVVQSPKKARNKGPLLESFDKSKSEARNKGPLLNSFGKSKAARLSQQQPRAILMRIAAFMLVIALIGFLIHLGQERYLFWKVAQEEPPVGTVISKHKSD